MRRGQFPPVILIIFLVLTLSLSTVFADTPLRPLPIRTVFIDPGHGGEDLGTRGPGGTLEKDVTLQLAHLVVDRIERQYQCKLSRREDYHVDIFNITGMANEVKADLFFSLHVGGSFSGGAGGFALYYYETPAKPDIGTHRSTGYPPELTDDRVPWGGRQEKHFSGSRQLARLIRNRLGQISDEPTLVAGVDALVLSGVDMPAILIEIGCLSNPSAEKKIQDMAYLSRIADAITAGIEDFLGDNVGISSMDLRQ